MILGPPLQEHLQRGEGIAGRTTWIVAECPTGDVVKISALKLRMSERQRGAAAKTRVKRALSESRR